MNICIQCLKTPVITILCTPPTLNAKTGRGDTGSGQSLLYIHDFPIRKDYLEFLNTTELGKSIIERSSHYQATFCDECLVQHIIDINNTSKI
jgi:hypothetical protein